MSAGGMGAWTGRTGFEIKGTEGGVATRFTGAAGELPGPREESPASRIDQGTSRGVDEALPVMKAGRC